MADLSGIIIALAIIIGNAGLYFIMISACKREGVSAFTIFRPFKNLEILQSKDWGKLITLFIVVGLLLYIGETFGRSAK